jgi:hypothetical protein
MIIVNHVATYDKMVTNLQRVSCEDSTVRECTAHNPVVKVDYNTEYKSRHPTGSSFR